VNERDGVAGRVVIVTGASKGVGRGVSLHLGRKGARLALIARRPDPLEALSAELDAIGAEHFWTTMNVADREATFDLVEQTVAKFGRVDGLVANAQTFRPVTPLDEVTESDMNLLFDTGAKGTLWGMQAVFPHMRDQGWGRIVTMGSSSGMLAPVGYAPYSASNEAIRALTRSAAREWGPFGITVNCVCPVSIGHRAPPDDDPARVASFNRTFQDQPIARDGDADTDIGPVVAFLLSEDSRYVTGQTLMADGGALMRP
jgi:NAD(P)-dependent dehydrogenase (short-subunit alcohol dehydrogenase family)